MFSLGICFLSNLFLYPSNNYMLLQFVSHSLLLQFLQINPIIFISSKFKSIKINFNASLNACLYFLLSLWQNMHQSLIHHLAYNLSVHTLFDHFHIFSTNRNNLHWSPFKQKYPLCDEDRIWWMYFFVITLNDNLQ